MKKNILFVHQSADLYGSDRALLVLVSKLNREKFYPIVLLPADGPLVAELLSAGVECHVLKIARLSRSTLSLRGVIGLPSIVYKSMQAFNLALRGRHIDLVHSNTLAVLSGMLWSCKNHIPHIWHVHEIIVNPILVRKVYTLLLSWCTDIIVCVSHAARNNLLQDKPSLASTSQVIWNGLSQTISVTRNTRFEYRQKLGLHEGDVLVTLIGRINRLKGQRLLVDAATILWQQGCRHIHFLIVGSVVPGQEQYLVSLQQSIEKSPSKANILLKSFALDVGAILDACDIAVIPSTEPESFGLVALEAMAATKPVIAANHGGLAEIVVDGETGLLIQPSNVSDLAAAIKRLAVDEKMRILMGKNGFIRYLENFTLESYVNNVEMLYDSILE